jgi:archaetidylinositol phosphate synthase
MLTRFKEQFQSMLKTEARILHNAGMTPNKISILGIFFAALAGCFFLTWRFNHAFVPLAAIFFLVSGFLDTLDGTVARMYGEATIVGGFLDSLLDRYADAFVLIAIIVAGLCDPLWGAVALAGSLLVSYSRARAEAAGLKMETMGLAERAERMIILAAGSFLTPFRFEALSWSIIVLAALTHFTVMHRSYYFYKNTRMTESLN